MSELIWNKAQASAPVLMLAHGAGAGMDSLFMNTVAQRLCDGGITVVRFEFPYMQERRLTGKKRPPDRQPKLLICWRERLAAVREQRPASPLFIGGKSMGGRMATLLPEEDMQAGDVKGIVCLGYPFYGLGKSEKPRIAHLAEVALPHLIVQGTRDAMGNQATVAQWPLAQLIQVHWLEDGNHDLKPRKRSGLTHEQHLASACEQIVTFIEKNKTFECR